MVYVFDTSSLRSLQHFYQTVFQTIWAEIDNLVKQNILISTREVWNELQRQNVSDAVLEWVKNNKPIFAIPTASELEFVAEILKVPHFQGLIGERQRLRGMPVADPFVIACAKVNGGTVVTEEGLKANAAKIPNVCDHFGVPWVNLEGLMNEQGWSF